MANRDQEWLCGTCGYMMDANIAADGSDVTPQEHDMTLCLNCGGVHVRQSDKWRPITTREFMDLSPDERADICRGQRAIRRELGQIDLAQDQSGGRA